MPNKKSNQNRNRNQMIQNPNIPKMLQNGYLRGAAAYPPTALALPWTFPTAPAVGQRRRLRAAGADAVAAQVQPLQRRVPLQHFCQSLRPPRNGTRWKRWRRDAPRCIEGGGCGGPTPHFQWISWFWCDSFEMLSKKEHFQKAWMPPKKLVFIKPQRDSQFKGFNQTGGERLLVAWLPRKLNQ